MNQNYNDLDNLRRAKERNLQSTPPKQKVEEKETPIDVNTQLADDVNNEVEVTNPISLDVKNTSDIIKKSDIVNNDSIKEVIDSIHDQSKTLKDVSQKLSSFGTMLSAKLESKPELKTVDSTTEVMSKIADEKQPSPPPEVVPNLESKPKKDDKPTKQKPDESNRLKKKSTDGKNPMVDVSKKGFAGLMKASDKITSLLFKMTIAAALEAIKMAAIIGVLIVGIDLIRIYLKYFIDWIGKKFDEFTISWGNYFSDFGKMGTIMDSISTAIGKIRNAWETGEFPSLAKAIVLGVKDVVVNIQQSINYALVKGFAKVLSALGFKKTAEDLNAWNAETYQNNTNGNLTTEEEKSVAKRQSNKIKEGSSMLDMAKQFMPINIIKNVLRDKDSNEYRMESAMANSTDTLKGMSDKDREETLVKVNRAKKLTTDYVNHAEATNVDNPKDVERLNKSYGQVTDLLKDNTFNKVPEVKTELLRQLDEAKVGMSKRQKPSKESPTQAPEAKSVKNIQQAMNNSQHNTNTQTNTANVQNTKVVNNKMINNQRPVTGYHPPGVYGALGVN